MAKPSWIRKLFTHPVTRTIRKAPRRVRLTMEALEDRCCPSTFTVTNTLGDGSVGSLPWAVGQANMHPGADTIAFDSTAFSTAKTITLGGTQFELSDTATTTITGPAAGVTVSGGGLSRVFQVDAGASASFSNLTITGSNGSGLGNNFGSTVMLTNCTISGNTGDGLFNYGGTATLTNCTVSGNGGNGLANLFFAGQSSWGSASATLTNCTLNGNTGSGASNRLNTGNGLFNHGSTATLTNCTLSGNTEAGLANQFYNPIGGRGASPTSATLTNCTLSGNSGNVSYGQRGAYTAGGGLYNNGGTATLKNCTVTGNSAGNGGGLYDHGGTATLTNCTVSGNSAGLAGGLSLSGTATLTNCTISGNTAGNTGGLSLGGTVTLTNCTVSGNTATYSSYGGMRNNGTATLTNCTVSGNSASRNSGGLGNIGTARLTNTIVAGNTAGAGWSGPDVRGTIVSQGYNLISKTDDSSGWIASDLTGTIAAPRNALLGPLGDNGGPTQTMALSSGSPAIDAGNNAAIPVGVTTDQRGRPRIVNTTVDIGAFELNPTTVSSIVRTTPSGQLTNASSVTYTVSFAVATLGLTASDFHLTGTANVADSNIGTPATSDGGFTWTVSIGTLANGTLILNLVSSTGLDHSPTNLPFAGETYTLDHTGPTATIVVADTALAVGETSPVIFTFNEVATGFTNADLTVANGTLSPVSSADGGTTWTATFTPTADIVDATNVITLDKSGVQDVLGNAGSGTTDSNNYAIDTRPATTVSSIVRTTPSGQFTAASSVTYTVSFAVATLGLMASDFHLTGTANVADSNIGTPATSNGGLTWTVSIGNLGSADGTLILNLVNSSDLDHNLTNLPFAGETYTLDHVGPTATIVVADSALAIGETSRVTFTFNEVATGFTNADLTVTNGTLSPVSSADGGITWRATFTPTAAIVDATNVITLDNILVQDLAGNAGAGTTVSNNYAIDTVSSTAVTVTNLTDAVNGDTTDIAALIANQGGDGISLREAVTAANNTFGAATITFDSTVFAGAQTIQLTAGQLRLSTLWAVTIAGPTTGVTVRGNNASQMFQIDAGVTASFSGLTITGGNAALTVGSGLTISATAALTLDNCTITGNTGIGVLVAGSATLTNCTVSNNTSSGVGGIRVTGTAVLTNCTVSGNSGTNNGGVVAAAGSTVTLTNCTVSGNTATGATGTHAGGINAQGTVTLLNTIVAGNFGTNPDVAGSLAPASSHNFIGGNPLLGSLGDYGGPTQTMPLLSGSTAIDAGAAAGAPSTDQRGYNRVGNVDIGAFEFGGVAVQLQTITFNSLANKTYGDADFALSATATSGLPVSFTASGSAGVYENTGTGVWYVHIGAAGSATITAHQAGDATYAPADSSANFTINKAPTTTTAVGAPTITAGTSSATISGKLNPNAGGQNVPAGEMVQVTLNGVTQDATLDSNDDFSTTFDTSTLSVSNAPYTIGFSYAGDSNFISATGSSTLTVTPAGAASFIVSGYPSPVTAGTSNPFTVTVQDAFGNTASGYTGTVTFSSTAQKVVLPANYTFTVGDAGVHAFSASLRSAGSQSITVTDSVIGTFAGSQSGIIVNPGTPHHFAIARYPYKPIAGTAGSFRVTVQDLYSNTINIGPNYPYTDTVYFTSTDPHAVLPAPYTFTAADAGVHDFIATLKTAGTQGITVLDMTSPAMIPASQANILEQPTAMSQLKVSGLPPFVTAGTAYSTLTVTAQDPFGNTIPTYQGTVTFTSSDGSAALPTNYSFISGDAGTHAFMTTLNTAGTQSITVTDAVNASITGTESGISVVAVQPTAGISSPSTGVPGQPLVYTLTASESGLPADTVYPYSINWGDGSPVQTLSGPSGTKVVHAFLNPGTSTISLTATDPNSHASVPATTSVTLTTTLMETDPYDATLTALYVGGTTDNDTIAITPVSGGGVKVGMNFVNYGSFSPTGHVVVYGQSGNDIIKTAAQSINGVLTYVNVPLLIFAGNGNDILNVTGSNVGNVLVGGSGSDRLLGGQGRDILIGGSGPSTLQAGSGGDILIGGTTDYDNNAAALASVLAEWSSGDDYATRIARITGSMSGGANGTFLLNSSTVQDDGQVNKLYGGAGMDWYFAGLMDVLFNKTSGEVVTQV